MAATLVALDAQQAGIRSGRHVPVRFATNAERLVLVDCSCRYAGFAAR